MYETRIEIYNNERAMNKGIKEMEKKGWEVVGSEVVPQGYGFFKTCCLGILFFPLALLGRKPVKHKVEFRREKSE